MLCSQTISKLHSKSLSKDSSNPHSRCLNAYWFLICNAWLQVPRATLPDDDAELADLARVSIEEWAAIKPLIMPALEQLPSGRWFMPRQMEESKKQDLRASAGSKGGSKKVANALAKRVAALEDEDAIENEDDSSLLGHVEHLKKTLSFWFNLPQGRSWPNDEERLMVDIARRQTLSSDIETLKGYHQRCNGYFAKSTRSLLEKWDHHVQVAKAPVPYRKSVKADHEGGF